MRRFLPIAALLLALHLGPVLRPTCTHTNEPVEDAKAKFEQAVNDEVKKINGGQKVKHERVCWGFGLLWWLRR